MSERKIPKEPINDIDEVKRILFKNIHDARETMNVFDDMKRQFMYKDARSKWMKLTDLAMWLGWYDEWLNYEYREVK